MGTFIALAIQEEPQISPLRYPGFPVEIGGVGAPHAAFLNEAMSSAEWQEIRVRSVEKHFHEGSAEPQVPPLRFAPVGMTRKG
jgi:hypothetical protein